MELLFPCDSIGSSDKRCCHLIGSFEWGVQCSCSFPPNAKHLFKLVKKINKENKQNANLFKGVGRILLTEARMTDYHGQDLQRAYAQLLVIRNVTLFADFRLTTVCVMYPCVFGELLILYLRRMGSSSFFVFDKLGSSSLHIWREWGHLTIACREWGAPHFVFEGNAELLISCSGEMEAPHYIFAENWELLILCLRSSPL